MTKNTQRWIIGAATLSASAALAACASGPTARTNPARPNDGAPGRVVATVKLDASLKHPYTTVAELAKSSATTSIVIGTVQAVDYEYAEGLAKTRVSVDVAKTLKGTAKGRIAVTEDGGYVDARTIQAENQAKFPDSPITARQGDVVDERFEGTEHPVIGQQVLLFIQNDPNKGHTGEYQGVMSALSRFTMAGGTFTRSASDEGLQASTTLDAVIAALR